MQAMPKASLGMGLTTLFLDYLPNKGDLVTFGVETTDDDNASRHQSGERLQQDLFKEC